MEFIGINIRNFRSIGKAGVTIYPTQKCNILIGQNNVGKSNTLRAMEKILNGLNPLPTAKEVRPLALTDYHRQDQSYIPQFTLYFKLDKTDAKDWVKVYGNEPVFFDFTWGNRFQVTDFSFSHITDFNQANVLLEMTTGRTWSNRVAVEHIRNEFQQYREQIFENYFKKYIPHVELIPEFRRIEANTTYLFHGSGIPEHLAKWQHPSIVQSKDREKFEKVQHFIRQLLHMPNAELEVDTSNNLILNNGITRLTLESYGNQWCKHFWE